MSLELPGAIEPHMPKGIAFERIRGAAVYVLKLAPPEDIHTAWDKHFDHRAPYLDDVQAAERVFYVGAANDLLRRLNDHVDGEKRKSALLRVCEIERLHSVFWFNDPDRAFERESGIATAIQNEHPEWYVHQR